MVLKDTKTALGVLLLRHIHFEEKEILSKPEGSNPRMLRPQPHPAGHLHFSPTPTLLPTPDCPQAQTWGKGALSGTPCGPTAHLTQ